jgi:epoxyqueuosine reductase
VFSTRLFLESVANIAKEAGLFFLGALNFSARKGNDLDAIFDNFNHWKSQGFAAEMEYMKRDLRQIFLKQVLSQFKSSLVFLMPYPPTSSTASRVGFGRIAAYALQPDYHGVLKKLLLKIAEKLIELAPAKYKVFTDSFPYLEKPLANLVSQRVFQGRNTLLIDKSLGSYILLGQILVSVEVEGFISPITTVLNCGKCNLCEKKCPTGALSCYMLDSRKCISYLTIEKRGPFTFDEISLIDDWLFGCDICQMCCPFNYKHLKFASNETGYFPIITALSLAQADFDRTFAGKPLKRAKFEGFIRNAIAVAYNQKFRQAIPYIKALTKSSNSTIAFTADIALSNWRKSCLTVLP